MLCVENERADIIKSEEYYGWYDQITPVPIYSHPEPPVDEYMPSGHLEQQLVIILLIFLFL